MARCLSGKVRKNFDILKLFVDYRDIWLIFRRSLDNNLCISNKGLKINKIANK